jgi:hypothetical protein
MFKTMKGALVAFLLILLSLSASFAQATTPAAARPEPDYVTEKGFKSKVLDVKYRDATSLAQVLRQLGSGFKGSAISANTEFKTITVRDFPENLATMEEALKRLDVPSTPRSDIELHMHVLIASNTAGKSQQIPAELKDVLTQLRGTLSYQNYELATSVIQRLTETSREFRGKGATQISGAVPGSPDLGMPYEYLISSVAVLPSPTGASTVRIGDFSFNIVTDKDRAQVQTALNLRDGEKVVVGTATMRDRALIVVLTARLVK